MRRTLCVDKSTRGVTLVELIVFLLMISIALVPIMKTFTMNISDSIDPLVRLKGLELAQSQLDEILSRKFDEATPPGGIPACNSVYGAACMGIVSDTAFNDVGDYNGYTKNVEKGYQVSVTIKSAGDDLALPNDQARLVTVTVALPDLSDVSGSFIRLSAYKVNF